jgi:hypothetical protein
MQDKEDKKRLHKSVKELGNLEARVEPLEERRTSTEGGTTAGGASLSGLVGKFENLQGGRGELSHSTPKAAQSLAHKLKTDVLLDEPQQMVLGNLIFQAEIVEERFGAVVLPHHDQQAPDDWNPTEHGQDHLLLTCFC